MHVFRLGPRVGRDVPLTPAVARLMLRGSWGMTLELDGVSSLEKAADVEVAEILATAKLPLSLPGCARISPAVAAALARSGGQTLQLDGLRELSADTAHELAKFRGATLQLDGLTTLSAAAARALAARRASRLTLRGLAALSAEAAAALAAAAAWDGELPGVTALDAADAVAVARALAARRSRLALPNLVRISPPAFLALVEKPDVVIPPLEALRFVAGADGSPADDFEIPEAFLQRPPPPRVRP